MWLRYAAFAAPVLLVCALAAALVLATDAGPSRSAAATPVPTPVLKQQCIDGAAVGAGNDGLAADCALLLAAKDPLRGTETLNWSANTAIASWEGITVGGSPSRVTGLWLDSNTSPRLYGRRITLTGTIPAELGGLSKLERLTLSRHELTGTIPVELSSLSELTDLQLYGNELTGTIPPELGNLSNLTRLSLGPNQLTGGIPPELGNLSNLGSLRLGNNQLSGSIPTSLGDLSNLHQLDLYGNTMLTGCIPAALRALNLYGLGSLGLDYCIPTTTYTLTTSAQGNGRTSPLPGTYSYRDDASVTVTATPDEGYRIASWAGDCSGTALYICAPDVWPVATQSTCVTLGSNDLSTSGDHVPSDCRARIAIPDSAPTPDASNLNRTEPGCPATGSARGRSAPAVSRCGITVLGEYSAA